MSLPSLESLLKSPPHGSVPPLEEETVTLDQKVVAEETSSIPKPTLPPRVRSGDVVISLFERARSPPL